MIHKSGRLGKIGTVFLRSPDAAAGSEHISEILGKAFIHPEQIPLHGLLVVGRVEPCGAPKLAIPGVSKFVRQEVAFEQTQIRIKKGAGIYAIITRLMMLETEMSHTVTESQQEMVTVIMPGFIKRSCFAHEVTKSVDHLAAGFQILGTVSRHVEIVARRDLWRERDFTKEAASKQRRID